MTLSPLSEYARVLKQSLPTSTFDPVPARLAWLLVHGGVAAAGLIAVALGWGGWPVALALVPLIAHSFAGMAFVAHDALHGSMVRSTTLRHVIGWIAFSPFCVSPMLWTQWHNRVHHGHTGKTGVDPDAYPTLDEYRERRLLRAADRFSPGRHRPLALVAAAIGFLVQVGTMLVRGRDLGLTPRRYALAITETVLAVAVWVAVAWVMGPARFLVGFALPLVLANALLMAYILTNHSLSPLTEINDPLRNSLSVTLPRALEVLHLDFGYHVEHHVFPAMSPRHARRVRDLLVANWPDRYQSLPLGSALARLLGTARVYKNEVTLVDPPSAREFATVGSEV